MGFFGALITLLCLSFCPLPALSPAAEYRVLYLAHQGQFEQAISAYRQATEGKDLVEYQPLQHIALAILQRAVKKSDPLEQLLGFYGAALSGNTDAMQLLVDGLEHPAPQIQMISMDLLGRLGGEESELLLQKSASSANLLTRLLALQILLQKQHPVALNQLESLYRKAPVELHPIFPIFFALSHDPKAIRTLRRMLHDANAEVRLATLLAIAQHNKEELMPQVRLCIGRQDPREQEVGAFGAGLFRDRQAIPLLLSIGEKCSCEVRLARALALEQLGVPKGLDFCTAAAKQNNLFAIQLLGELEGGVAPLKEIVKSGVLEVRYNAALALLKQKERSCLPLIMELLLEGPRELTLTQIRSPGGTLSAYRLYTSATLNAESALILAQGLEIRKQILSDLLTLPTDVFFEVAATLFKQQQKDLIPAVVDMLVKMGNKRAVELLKEAQNQVGAPFVRMCASIGLYRIDGGAQESKKIREWLLAHKSQEMVEMSATPTPPVVSSLLPGFTLTPQEDTLLFLSALEAVVEKQQAESISILLELLASGNAKNQPMLAGLLLRSTQ